MTTRVKKGLTLANAVRILADIAKMAVSDIDDAEELDPIEEDREEDSVPISDTLSFVDDAAQEAEEEKQFKKAEEPTAPKEEEEEEASAADSLDLPPVARQSASVGRFLGMIALARAKFRARAATVDTTNALATGKFVTSIKTVLRNIVRTGVPGFHSSAADTAALKMIKEAQSLDDALGTIDTFITKFETIFRGHLLELQRLDGGATAFCRRK